MEKILVGWLRLKKKKLIRSEIMGLNPFAACSSNVPVKAAHSHPALPGSLLCGLVLHFGRKHPGRLWAPGLRAGRGRGVTSGAHGLPSHQMFSSGAAAGSTAALLLAWRERLSAGVLAELLGSKAST